LKFAGNSTGYLHSEEVKNRLSDIKVGKFIGEKNPFFGKTHSSENKELFLNIALARPKSHNAKSILLEDLNKNTTQEFKSMTALSLFLKADKGTLAKYRDSGELFRGIYKILLLYSKSVILLDNEKNIIQEFNSLTALSKHIGIDSRTAKRYLDSDK
jgi:hypothetical protein